MLDGFGGGTHDPAVGRIALARIGARGMSWQIIIMYAVAGVLALTGAGLLLLLTRPSGPAKVYVFRMVGIMLLSGGAVLGMSAAAMQQWSGDDAAVTHAGERDAL